MQFITAGASAAGQLTAFAFHSLRAIRDPTDADAVSAVGELSSLHALEGMTHAMMADRVGRVILRQQPLVTDETLELARGQAPGTFGSRYAAYMDYNRFTPSGRTPVRHVADPTLAYVMTRYRQCHDFLHTITEAGRSVEEELAVKLLEWQHTGLPLGLLAVAGGSPHLDSKQRAHMKVYWRWAAEQTPCSAHGSRYVPFYLNVPWEELLSRPVEEARAVAGIVPLPKYLEKHGILRTAPPSTQA